MIEYNKYDIYDIDNFENIILKTFIDYFFNDVERKGKWRKDKINKKIIIDILGRLINDANIDEFEYEEGFIYI